MARRLIHTGVLACIFAIGISLLGLGGSALAKPRPPKLDRDIRKIVIGANKLALISDRCPASYPHPVGPDFGVAKGAGTPGSVALTASHPIEKRGWFVEVWNMTSQPQTVIAGTLCLRADARFAYPRTRNTIAAPNGSSSVAAPNGYSTGSSNCPRSVPHAIDTYFGVQSAANDGALLLATAYPFTSRKRSGFVTGVRNFAGHPLLFFAGSVCTSLRTKIGFGRSQVAAGKTGGATTRCPRQTPTPVSAAFYALPPSASSPNDGNIALDGSFPLTPNVWAIDITNLTDHTVKYALGAVCVG